MASINFVVGWLTNPQVYIDNISTPPPPLEKLFKRYHEQLNFAWWHKLTVLNQTFSQNNHYKNILIILAPGI